MGWRFSSGEANRFYRFKIAGVADPTKHSVVALQNFNLQFSAWELGPIRPASAIAPQNARIAFGRVSGLKFADAVDDAGRAEEAPRSSSLLTLAAVGVALLAGAWTSIRDALTSTESAESSGPLVDKYASDVVRIAPHPALAAATSGWTSPDFLPAGEGLTHVERVLGQEQQLRAHGRVFLMLNGEDEGVYLPWTHRQDEEACLLELAQTAVMHLGADPDLVTNGLRLFSADGLPILAANELDTQRVAHVLLDGQLWVWPGIKVGYVREIEGCTVTTQSLRPKVFTVEGFFTQEEADAIIAEGIDHLTRSPVDNAEAVDGYHSDRTSFTAFLDDSHFTREFRVRSARVARLPSPSFTERMQLVRYETGQFFRKHEDYFDSKEFMPKKQLAAGEFVTWTEWASAKIEELRQVHGDDVVPAEFLPGGAMFPDAQSTTVFQHALLRGFLEDADESNFFWEHADMSWRDWIEENLERGADDIMDPILESKGYMLPFIVASWEKRVGVPSLVYSFTKLPVHDVTHFFRWIRWVKERVQTLMDTHIEDVPMYVRPEGKNYPTFYMSFQTRLAKLLLEDYSREYLVEALTEELYAWLLENEDMDDVILELLRRRPGTFDLVLKAWTKRAGSQFAYDKPKHLHHFEPNRFATLFLYLNECPEGGETVFPYSKERLVTEIEREGMTECSEGLAVPPVKLTASLFYSQTPMNDLDPTSLHGGCPPAKGIKCTLPTSCPQLLCHSTNFSVLVHRQRRSSTGTLYGEPAGAAAAPRGSYTPAQMQALYLSRGRPDMAFMSNQGRLPVEVPELQQTCTVKNHVNLKKASLKLQQSPTRSNHYALEFQFDATKPCRISVFLVATETIDADTGSSSFALVHADKNPVLIHHYPSGLGQIFVLKGGESEEDTPKEEGQEEPLPLLDFSFYEPGELEYKPGAMQFPLIVVLEEIYGIDGSVAAAPKTERSGTGIDGQADAAQAPTEDIEIPEGAECIICLCEPRNTTILPCRHMCLCSECAEALRKSSSTCPICRTRVEALLQIRVEAKETTTTEAEEDTKTEVEESK
ncbi:unnamed protein product [Phytophthora fragariaefolia]|uniref:Unnamed protein product n=1 Tax=Phytophthora fragariaefolia TaxID=1490495 RepID=A0A9W6U2C9_9STRA|nr:unnamed protein product [Phytophthora fragariaefolia]